MTLGFTTMVAFAVAGQPAAPVPHDLSDATVDKWLAHIAASDADLGWKKGIAWAQSFRVAIARAARGDKPVLLYVAAGDPQGCV